MIRFFKSTAFKIFAVIAAALLAGSLFAVASRSGSSPLTSVTSFIFSPIIVKYELKFVNRIYYFHL